MGRIKRWTDQGLICTLTFQQNDNKTLKVPFYKNILIFAFCYLMVQLCTQRFIYKTLQISRK